MLPQCLLNKEGVCLLSVETDEWFEWWSKGQDGHPAVCLPEVHSGYCWLCY